MFTALLMAAALTFTTAPENDCAAGARIECRELMGLVFRSADDDTGRATRLIEGQRWSVTPIAIARLGATRALITANASEGGYHVQVGTWSLYIFDSEAPRLRRAVLDFQSSGSSGYPGSGTLIALEDNTPALLVEGGGTWQGHSCTWASVDLITDTGTRVLIAPVLVSFHAGGPPYSPDIEGQWSVLTRQYATLQYADGLEITFTPRADGRLHPHRATPRQC